MLDVIARRNNKNFDKKNLNRFVREVTVHTKKLQTKQCRAPMTYEEHFKEVSRQPCASTHFLQKSSPDKKDASSMTKQYQNNVSNTETSNQRKRDVYEAHLRHYAACKSKWKRHYINICDIIDKERNWNSRINNVKQKWLAWTTPKWASTISTASHIIHCRHTHLYSEHLLTEAIIKTSLVADKGVDVNLILATIWIKFNKTWEYPAVIIKPASVISQNNRTPLFILFQYLQVGFISTDTAWNAANIKEYSV